MGTFQMFNAREVASDVADNFLKGNSDKVEVIYGEFKSVAVQAPTFTHFLPVQPVQVVGTERRKKFQEIIYTNLRPKRSWTFFSLFI